MDVVPWYHAETILEKFRPMLLHMPCVCRELFTVYYFPMKHDHM